MKTLRASLLPVSLLLAVLVAACTGDDDADGNITVAVADAPMDDASRVVVAFTGIELRPQDGDIVRFSFTPRPIDLLSLSGGRSALLLAGVDVPPGAYSSAELKIQAAEDSVLDSFIELAADGSQHELALADGAESGLRVTQSFVVPQGGRGDFTIDFDLRRSVHNPDVELGAFLLRPRLRLVNNAQAGSIAGTADIALRPECRPAVYVFSGSGVTPDDVDGASPEPLTSARLGAVDSGYHAAFLPAGNYTVALTCDAAADDPATDQSITFLQTENASVVAGQVTQLNFNPAPPSPAP